MRRLPIFVLADPGDEFLRNGRQFSQSHLVDRICLAVVRSEGDVSVALGGFEITVETLIKPGEVFPPDVVVADAVEYFDERIVVLPENFPELDDDGKIIAERVTVEEEDG